MPRTDFSSWKHETLVRLADELNADNKRLRDDNKMLLAAWRLAVTEKCRAEALAGSPAPVSLPQSSAPAWAKADGSQQ